MVNGKQRIYSGANSTRCLRGSMMQRERATRVAHKHVGRNMPWLARPLERTRCGSHGLFEHGPSEHRDCAADAGRRCRGRASGVLGGVGR